MKREGWRREWKGQKPARRRSSDRRAWLWILTLNSFPLEQQQVLKSQRIRAARYRGGPGHSALASISLHMCKELLPLAPLSFLTQAKSEAKTHVLGMPLWPQEHALLSRIS